MFALFFDPAEHKLIRNYFFLRIEFAKRESWG